MQLSESINNAMYGYACDFLPAWVGKWDRALYEKDWPKIETLIRAAYKHAGYTMPLPDLAPWWPIPKTYTARVDIVDKDGHIHACRFLSVSVKAISQEEAEAKIKGMNYHIKHWLGGFID